MRSSVSRPREMSGRARARRNWRELERAGSCVLERAEQREARHVKVATVRVCSATHLLLQVQEALPLNRDAIDRLVHVDLLLGNVPVDLLALGLQLRLQRILFFLRLARHLLELSLLILLKLRKIFLRLLPQKLQAREQQRY